MPPGSEKRRGKRPRNSSREEASAQEALPAPSYTSQPNPALSGASSDIRSPPAPSATWSGGGTVSLNSDAHFGRPINVITSYPPPGKIAIPALRPPQSLDSSVRGSRKGRTSHACDACRKAKAGCTGENPCTRCKNAGISCVYGDGKREHDRKMMSRLTQESVSLNQRNIDVADALRRIQLDTSLSQVELRTAIDDVLSMNPTPVSPGYRALSFDPLRRPSIGHEEREPSNEDEDDDEVGSTGSLDVINVDTDRDETRATGHLGKASAVSWTKRTNEEMRRASLQENTGGLHEAGHTLSSYHVEDADVEYVDLTTVNPFDWPEYSRADSLVQLYFDHTHQAFPILDRAKFMAKYAAFPRGANNLGTSDLIWLGTLNAIFAISAVFGDLTNRDDEGHVDDHMVYCAIAKALCMDETFLFQDARLSTTIFLGLMSLYYISICKLNRAWTICGLAIRQGLTLGLHVRSEVKDLSDVAKEHRARLWWAVYSMEVLLNELTGRPSCICDRDISTPLPINVGEDEFIPSRPLYHREDSGQSVNTASSGRRGSRGRPSATYEMPEGYCQSLALSFPAIELPVTSSTYFIYRTQLSIISHQIVSQLYCAASIKEKWSEVQETMKNIDARLVSWRDSLPKEFDVMFDTWSEPDWSDPNTLPRIALAISFNSSRMILFRPCLCRVEGRLKHQPQASRDFEQEAVENCIHSARRMIRLLKWSARSEARFYSISPWWSTLHYLCEALSVLMLEMAFEVEHLPNETAEILADAKEGIFWLAMLSAGSIAARKAWEIFDNLIRLVAPKIRWSVFDLPTSVPVPARYNWRRFNSKPNTDPWTHLSREKLEEHQASQPTVPDSTVTWTNQGQNQYVPERSAPEQFGNQLHSSTAIECFANMGQLYGSYDDPWPQLFVPAAAAPPLQLSGAGPSMGSSALGSMSGMSGSEGYRTMSQEGRYVNQPTFDSNLVGFEMMNPANARAFQQGNAIERQEEEDMQRRREHEFGGFDHTAGF